MKNFTPKNLNLFKLLYLVSIVLVSSNSRSQHLIINDIVYKVANNQAVTSTNGLPYEFVAKQEMVVLPENSKSGHSTTLARSDNFTTELHGDFSSTTHIIRIWDSNAHFSYLKRAVSCSNVKNLNNNLFPESDSEGHRDFSDLLKINASGLSLHYYRYC